MTPTARASFIEEVEVSGIHHLTEPRSRQDMGRSWSGASKERATNPAPTLIWDVPASRSVRKYTGVGEAIHDVRSCGRKASTVRKLTLERGQFYDPTGQVFLSWFLSSWLWPKRGNSWGTHRTTCSQRNLHLKLLEVSSHNARHGIGKKGQWSMSRTSRHRISQSSDQDQNSKQNFRGMTTEGKQRWGNGQRSQRSLLHRAGGHTSCPRPHQVNRPVS